MSENKSLFGDCHEMAHIWQGCKHDHVSDEKIY